MCEPASVNIVVATHREESSGQAFCFCRPWRCGHDTSISAMLCQQHRQVGKKKSGFGRMPATAYELDEKKHTPPSESVPLGTCESKSTTAETPPLLTTCLPLGNLVPQNTKASD